MRDVVLMRKVKRSEGYSITHFKNSSLLYILTGIYIYKKFWNIKKMHNRKG